MVYCMPNGVGSIKCMFVDTYIYFDFWFQLCARHRQINSSVHLQLFSTTVASTTSHGLTRSNRLLVHAKMKIENFNKTHLMF